MAAPKPLDKQTQSEIANASPNAIQSALKRFAGGKSSGWIQATFPFPDGQIPVGTPLGQVPALELIDAIAIRGPLHLIDGWSYLSRAFSAVASGDAHSGRHLAYYAELRAALAILATQGFGSFNNRHAVVDLNGNISVLGNRNTHEMVWLALESWSTNPQAFDAIAGSVEIAGATIASGIDVFFPSPSRRSLGSGLIQSWGLDLSQMYLDKEERNNSSYQSKLLTPLVTTCPDDIAFLQSFWKAFEPQSFDLERNLFRALLEEQINQMTGSREISGRDSEYGRLDSRIQSKVSLEFLSRLQSPADIQIMRHAADKTLPAPVQSIMSRAALLLRIAGSLVERNFTAASVDPIDDLYFWWPDYGEKLGFWPSSMQPVSPLELWQDIESALEEISDASVASRFDWLSTPNLGLPRLCEAERAGLWAICN